jgi:2-phospho-L-lactate guanylyltransferase
MTKRGIPATYSRAGTVDATIGTPAWTIVIPFKGGSNAKSRLGNLGHVRSSGPVLRRELALAFLEDTVRAAATAKGVARIIVVSSDPAPVETGGDALFLPDPGQGLNAAVEAGIAYARTLDSLAPVAALTADLPCLRPRDLEEALDQARHHRLAVVPDRHGTGTTMISALPYVAVSAQFGTGSCAAHIRAGHSVLALPENSTLRADIDTVDDLADAVRRGVGDHTRDALQAAGSGARPGPRRHPSPV